MHHEVWQTGRRCSVPTAVQHRSDQTGMDDITLFINSEWDSLIQTTRIYLKDIRRSFCLSKCGWRVTIRRDWGSQSYRWKRCRYRGLQSQTGNLRRLLESQPQPNTSREDRSRYGCMLLKWGSGWFQEIPPVARKVWTHRQRRGPCHGNTRDSVQEQWKTASTKPGRIHGAGFVKKSPAQNSR